MQVKCNECGAMFFVPNVKKSKEVACRKCGTKTLAEPSEDAAKRLVTTIRGSNVNDVAAELYSQVSSNAVRATAAAPEPGDKVVSLALRIYGALFLLGIVFGIVAMVGNGMDDWQGPAAVALIVMPIPVLIPTCSFAAFFKSRSKTARLVRWLARSEGTPPPELGNQVGSVKGWGLFYCIVGVLYFFVALLGILTAILVANEARNSYYGSHMTEALLPWQISFCAIGMFLGFKNILLSVLFRGQARFYTVEGRRSLSDGWGETNKNSRFFRVKVAMPK